MNNEGLLVSVEAAVGVHAGGGVEAAVGVHAGGGVDSGGVVVVSLFSLFLQWLALAFRRICNCTCCTRPCGGFFGAAARIISDFCCIVSGTIYMVFCAVCVTVISLLALPVFLCSTCCRNRGNDAWSKAKDFFDTHLSLVLGTVTDGLRPIFKNGSSIGLAVLLPFVLEMTDLKRGKAFSIVNYVLRYVLGYLLGILIDAASKMFIADSGLGGFGVDKDKSKKATIFWIVFIRMATHTGYLFLMLRFAGLTKDLNSTDYVLADYLTAMAVEFNVFVFVFRLCGVYKLKPVDENVWDFYDRLFVPGIVRTTVTTWSDTEVLLTNIDDPTVTTILKGHGFHRDGELVSSGFVKSIAFYRGEDKIGQIPIMHQTAFTLTNAAWFARHDGDYSGVEAMWAAIREDQFRVLMYDKFTALNASIYAMQISVYAIVLLLEDDSVAASSVIIFTLTRVSFSELISIAGLGSHKYDPSKGFWRNIWEKVAGEGFPWWANGLIVLAFGVGSVALVVNGDFGHVAEVNFLGVLVVSSAVVVRQAAQAISQRDKLAGSSAVVVLSYFFGALAYLVETHLRNAARVFKSIVVGLFVGQTVLAVLFVVCVAAFVVVSLGDLVLDIADGFNPYTEPVVTEDRMVSAPFKQLFSLIVGGTVLCGLGLFGLFATLVIDDSFEFGQGNGNIFIAMALALVLILAMLAAVHLGSRADDDDDDDDDSDDGPDGGLPPLVNVPSESVWSEEKNADTDYQAVAVDEALEFGDDEQLEEYYEEAEAETEQVFVGLFLDHVLDGDGDQFDGAALTHERHGLSA